MNGFHYSEDETNCYGGQCFPRTFMLQFDNEAHKEMAHGVWQERT